MVKMNIHKHWTRVTRFNPLRVSAVTHKQEYNISMYATATIHIRVRTVLKPSRLAYKEHKAG